MAESPVAAAPAPAAAADSIVDADDYDAQLEVVRSLKAAGASPTRVKSAAMKLAQLKRATWVPSGTASRKKKRRAAIEAVKGGVRSAVVMDGRVPHCALLHLFGDGVVGTSIVADA